MFSSIAKAFGGLISLLNIWARGKERKEHRQAGANEEMLRQREDVEDAEDRMADTERSDRLDAIERLRRKGL